MKLTAHFTLEEFELSQTAIRHGIDNSVPESLMSNMRRTAETMEEIRTLLLNKPIQVTSGYRCPALEKKISGRAYGQHMKALACDFVCPTYGSPLMIAEILSSTLRDFDQLIWEGTWVHVGLAEGTQRKEILTAKFTNGKASYSRGLNP